MSWRTAKRPHDADPNKWVIRKVEGIWLVWRPNEPDPVTRFYDFPEGWSPNCYFFMHSLCRCSDECRR